MYHMAYGTDIYVLGELVQCYPENSAVKTDHSPASPNTRLPISLGLGVFAITIIFVSLGTKSIFKLFSNAATPAASRFQIISVKIFHW